MSELHLAGLLFFVADWAAIGLIALFVWWRGHGKGRRWQ